MKKLFAILLTLFAFAGVKANDGAFYSDGNQLIPITETTIKVQKEILKITRVHDYVNGYGSLFQVNVYYEFFNPGAEKDLIVGFESPTPDGNAFFGTLEEAYAGQPFTYDFKVVMNGKNLPFGKAKVTVLGIDRDNTDQMVAGGTFSGDFTLILPADAFTVRCASCAAPRRASLRVTMPRCPPRWS